jgi:hypothetical protein
VARLLEDFLTGYLKYTEKTEPPTQFHLWIGISAIASALQRKVYTIRGAERIYPNQYIVLIGASGRCRKGVAFGIVEDIIREVSAIKFTAESITREALIRDLKEAINTYEDPDSGITFHCSLASFQEELSIFLGQNDIKFLADLTDWYNCKSEWTYRTKNMGTDKLQGLCFNLLGGTAPDWLISILPQEAIGGGFTARVIFVVEEEKKCLIGDPPPLDAELRRKLIHDLEQISLLTGQFKFSAEAKERYVKWYERDSTKSGISDPKFDSYNERRATHITKIAMAMSASRGSDRTISINDFERALTILTKAEEKMARVFRSLGKARYAEITMKVFDLIVQRGSISSSEVLKSFYGDIDTYTLKIVEETLLGMKVISIARNLKTQESIYEVIK